MTTISERLAQIVGSAHRLGLRRFLAAWMASVLLLILVDVIYAHSPASQKLGLRWQSQLAPLTRQLSSTSDFTSQSGHMPGGANTCKCLPPIPSEATATGACTRTQDDDTFCELTFSLSQRAAAVSRLPTFDKYAMDWKLSIPKEGLKPLVDRLQDEEISGLSPEEVAASIRAVAAIAAFQRPSDIPTQSHFRDIFQMLTFQEPADRDYKAPVLRSMDRFAAKLEGAAPEIESISVPNGRKYELVTTPGCIAFGESQFTFMVRATGAAAPCEQLRR